MDEDVRQRIGAYWIGNHGYIVHGRDQLLHRTVAGWALGRELLNHERVHHVNYVKTDCRRANLLICDEPYHKLVHRRWDAMLAGFDWRTHSKCSVCKTYHPVDMFAKTLGATREHQVHNICKAESNRIRREKGYKRLARLRKKLEEQHG